MRSPHEEWTTGEHHYEELDADPRAPAAARGRVSAALAGRDKEIVATAALLVSELVSNAVRHASHVGDPVGLDILLSTHRLRIEVVDVGNGFEVDEETNTTDGFGLQIVDYLAEEWGVDHGPPHTVWCEMTV